MDYQAETMQDDMYEISADGWYKDDVFHQKTVKR
jgi:hypothetical protein